MASKLRKKRRYFLTLLVGEINIYTIVLKHEK